jgi:membrane-associated protein
VLHEFVAEQRTHAGRHVGRRQPLGEPAVVLQLECHLRHRQRNAAEHVVAVAVLGLFGTQEFAPRRGVVIQVGNIDDRTGIECRRLGRPPLSTRQACAAPASRLVMVTRATLAIDASASPRKPMVATASRSSSDAIFDVACRASASGRSSGGMPPPSSATRRRFTPPASSCTRMSRLPASRLFSSNSFSTDAGRSTTSPAAIWLISRSGSSRMTDIGRFGKKKADPILRAATCIRYHPGSKPVTKPMELLATFIDIMLHLDKHLAMLVAQYGAWVYAILFIIVFCETGLVVTPFLPGDSLLFVAGAIAAAGGMHIGLLIVLLIVAAVLGDAVNYAVGSWFGPKVFRWESSRFFNRTAFDRTHAFYEKHGGKTIIIARFMPLIRTFAPFVAGVAQMSYARFAMFNITGAVIWVVSLSLAGYWFGNLPWVKDNLTLVILAIIAISLAPLVVAWVRAKFGHASESQA